ncbi:MAG: 16S rRNA (cytidine(1402)-2'-O)-methyltransferase [Clostridia bacterium]|nr:16S rRNA (cytidine(1402)-2'-O)-methyltransferase [Clostridia bacterium]
MLYVVATPIGNLDDISMRALKTLENAELIAAEDTRHTLGLLEHFGIKKPLVSYFEHNKLSRGPELIAKLKEGADIALVSDAGMPGICDPGYELIRDCIDAGIEVTVIPGPCACVTALVLSGLPTDVFVFEGFIGTENKQRKAFFDRLGRERRTTICYEAPHRMQKTLSEIEALFGDAGTPDRRISVCRELTKTHEEVLRGTASELKDHFGENAPRGEFVLCIEGSDKAPGSADVKGNASEITGASAGCSGLASENEMRAYYYELTNSGSLPKEAMKALQNRFGITRNEAYRIVKLPEKL